MPPPAPGIIFADLHVHLGRAADLPVKITASPAFDLRAALLEAGLYKGLDAIGLVDCCAGPVLKVLADELATGSLSTAGSGGLIHSGGRPAGRRDLLVILGCEVELVVAGAPVHFLAYLPGLEQCERLRERLAPHVRNQDLGCQRAHELSPLALGSAVRDLGGVFGLAHAFTPHRGLYGSTRRTLGQLFGRPAPEVVDFVEMGLSADAAMADMLSELSLTPLVASSDAHGAGAVAREATAFRVEGLGFGELELALFGRKGRGIAATYGLDPRLGKYHRSACLGCGWTAASEPSAGPFLSCPGCGAGRGFVIGVLDRILAIADRSLNEAGARPRPPYHCHVPLCFLPGVGPATRLRLLEAFGSEVEVLHHVPQEALARVAGPRAADTILAGRRGELSIRAGGGGDFGRVAPP